MKLRTLKVEDGDWAEWKERANAAGMSLSGWIRERCNEKGEGVPRARGVRMARRRVAAGRGESGVSGTAGTVSEVRGELPATCANGHRLEPGHAAKCVKWGCEHYAFRR